MPDAVLAVEASVRTLNVPTTSSPDQDLAFSSTRGYRAVLRFLRFLLFFRAASLLCTVLRFPVRGGVSSAPFSFARPGSYLDSNVLGAAVPTRLHVHLILDPDTDLAAYSRGS